MGTYYSIYAEVRVGNKWYNINPLMRNENGEAWVYPVMSGQSHMRDAVEELEEDCYMRGCPENLSEELKKVYSHSSDEIADNMWNSMTYGEYYNQTLFVVNYGKHVKSRVKSTMPTRYRGYVSKYCLSEYEIGNIDDISNWLTEEEYRELSDEERKSIHIINGMRGTIGMAFMLNL